MSVTVWSWVQGQVVWYRNEDKVVVYLVEVEQYTSNYTERINLIFPNKGGITPRSSRESSLVHLKFFLYLSVAVLKLQVAILARSLREMSQTVRID